jgi:hypothetical protein
VNWKLHKRDIAEGRAKPFKVAKFDAAVRLETEQCERRHAKRAEKRQRKEARGPTPRRRLLSRKDLTKKGTARKAPARNAASTSSSATEKSPRKQTTPLFETSSPSGSVRKRKRPVSDQRSPSPALSVNDVLNSQYSMFNEPATTSTSTKSPRKSSSSHLTAVPKRARANDSSDGKEAIKQRSGTSDGRYRYGVPAPHGLRFNSLARMQSSSQTKSLHRVKILNLRQAKIQSFPTNSCVCLSLLPDDRSL